MLVNIDVGSFASRDEPEVAGYRDALETLFANWRAIDLTETARYHEVVQGDRSPAPARRNAGKPSGGAVRDVCVHGEFEQGV